MSELDRPRIEPELTELTEPFWSAARQGRILLQRCTHCGTLWHPPAPVCPSCRSEQIEWVPSSGRGRLYSYTQVTHSVHTAAKGAVPYLVALVDLQEGPRVVCTLLGVEDVTMLSPTTAITIGLGPSAVGSELAVARVSAGDAADPDPRA